MIKKDESFGVVPVCIAETSAPLFLLIRQQTGHWAFPKGHAEGKEEPIESALRELEEETAICAVEIVDGYTYIQNYTFEQEGLEVHKTVTFFLGVVAKQEVSIKEGEIQDFGWYKYEEALKLLTYQDSKELLTDVHSKLNLFLSQT